MNNTPETVQILMSIVPIVGIAIAGFVVFFYLLWRHREIIVLVKSNLYEPPKSFDFKVYALLTGIVLTSVGFVISLVFMLMNGISYQLLGGLIPFAVGISLFVFYKVCPPKQQSDE